MLSDAYDSDLDHDALVGCPMEPDPEPSIILAIDAPHGWETARYLDWPSVIARLSQLPLSSCRLVIGGDDETGGTMVLVSYVPTRCEIAAHTGRQEAC